MVKTVSEVLEELSASNGSRFSRKAFNDLLNAIASDPEFKSQVAIVKKGEFAGYEDIAVGEDFRKWVRKIVEKAGMDSAESSVVTSGDFPIADMGWMYDFFAEAMWLYMTNGGKFDMPKKEGFEGSIVIEDVEASTETGKEVKKPGSSEILGTYDITKGAHKKLRAKSSCPSYLVNRVQVK